MGSSLPSRISGTCSAPRKTAFASRRAEASASKELSQKKNWDTAVGGRKDGKRRGEIIRENHRLSQKQVGTVGQSATGTLKSIVVLFRFGLQTVRDILEFYTKLVVIDVTREVLQVKLDFLTMTEFGISFMASEHFFKEP